MAEIKWIKIATDMFDNRKIKSIESMRYSDTIIVIWVKLLCLAGQSNNGGIISLNENIPYSKKMLCSILNVSESKLRIALNTFLEYEMIRIFSQNDSKIDPNSNQNETKMNSNWKQNESKLNSNSNQFIEILNWDKYQASNKMEILKEQNRERIKRYREKNKLIKQYNLENSNVTSNVTCNVTGNANVTQCNAIEVRSKKKEVISNNLSISQETDVTLHAKRFYPEWSDRQIALIKKLAEEYGCIQVKNAIEKVASKDGINDPISYIKKILISKDV